jgi:acyl-CoA dehydrogenase
MMLTTCRLDRQSLGDQRPEEAFITGAHGASVGIVMAKSDDGACMFLVDLPDPAVRIERMLHTIDSSMPGGHALVVLDNLRVPADQVLGAVTRASATRRSASRRRACRTACAGWVRAIRAHEIATGYATRARPSASCWWTTKASASCWPTT